MRSSRCGMLASKTASIMEVKSMVILYSIKMIYLGIGLMYLGVELILECIRDIQ